MFCCAKYKTVSIVQLLTKRGNKKTPSTVLGPSYEITIMPVSTNMHRRNVSLKSWQNFKLTFIKMYSLFFGLSL